MFVVGVDVVVEAVLGLVLLVADTVHGAGCITQNTLGF